MYTEDQIQSPSLKQRLKRVTLTGIDEKTPIEALYEITRRAPYVEFGVLYSNKLSGQGRYPRLKWMDNLAAISCARPGLNLALHVCGSAVGDLFAGEGHVSVLANSFNRIQVNFISTRYSADLVRQLLRDRSGQTIITQHNFANKNLWKELEGFNNHSVLFDASGGRGIGPDAWQRPLYLDPALGESASKPMCGYAGGLGPENLEAQLRDIDKASMGEPFWIDAESKLRNRVDEFDLVLAQKFVDIAAKRIQSEQSSEVAV